MSAELALAKQLASQLGEWDQRIVEISAFQEIEGDHESRVDLICKFNPEPSSDSIGFFWIVNLLVRMEHEGIDSAYDLGFQIGDQVFLPSGKICNQIRDYVVLWTNNEAR